MPRIMNVSFEVTDEEFANFLARASGNPSTGPGGVPHERNVQVNVSEPDDDNAPADANAPTVDKNNVPWSADFHASSKTLNADGTWRRKRGVDAAKADAYEASFKAAPVIPEPVAAPAPVAPEPVAAPAMPGMPMPGLPQPAAPVAPQPVSYEEVIAIWQKALEKDPSLAQGYAALYAEVGITDPNDLLTNETLRAKLAEKLRAIIAG